MYIYIYTYKPYIYINQGDVRISKIIGLFAGRPARN